tara:strand:+ start:24679 stop:25194 length:516 start_codon:yes stop_codon:yes gene_type:complete
MDNPTTNETPGATQALPDAAGSVIWRVPYSGGRDRKWKPGEVALLGGGSWWTRGYILNEGKVNTRGWLEYSFVRESTVYLDYQDAAYLHTVESARENQERFRDEMMGKDFRRMMELIDELSEAPRPDWWEKIVHSWCFETVDGCTPEWMEKSFGTLEMQTLRDSLSLNTPG